MNEEKTVDAVISATHDLLVRHNYSANDIAARYTRIWKRFKVYAVQQGEEMFSADLADRYLSETYHFPQEYDVLGAFPSEVVNEIRAIRSLKDCYLYGSIAPFLKPKREYVSVHFPGIYSSYRANRSGYGRSKESIAQYMRTAENFLDFVEGCGVTDCRNITSEMVDKFIVLQQCYTKHTVKMKLRTAKVFFRYLFEEGYVDTDFSYRVPNVTIFRKGHIPTTLTSEQCEKLLNGIDRGNPIGLRDYAIILLALTLGLRDSDIRELRFDNFDWTNKKVSIVQEKTNHTLDLPLPDHVIAAIAAYLKNGRPQVKSPYIFLQHKAPYRQMQGLYDVMGRALASAGISLGRDKSKGLHVLRHSLASNLLEQGVPLSTISEILGQRDYRSTDIYLHTDIVGLRKCALDPEVLGNG
jgi:site-specific recombinase XerD